MLKLSRVRRNLLYNICSANSKIKIETVYSVSRSQRALLHVITLKLAELSKDYHCLKEVSTEIINNTTGTLKLTTIFLRKY